MIQEKKIATKVICMCAMTVKVFMNILLAMYVVKISGLSGVYEQW